MTMRTLFLAGAMALALPSLAAADDRAKKTNPQPASLSDLERKEVIHRHHVNVMEIEMGKLAKQRGTAAVKSYGAMLITDHSKADKDVRALARKRGITMSDHPTAGDDDVADHQKAMTRMDRLKTLEGAAFDAEFIPAMVEGHTKEIERVTAALPQVSDGKVKALLEKTLPSLRKHADKAKALQGSQTAATPDTRSK